MKDFKITKQFVSWNNRIINAVLKAFSWNSDKEPLDSYQIGEIIHWAEDVEYLYNNTAITPEEGEYSLIGELLALSRGVADLQPTFEEWMAEIEKIELPEQSFYDMYEQRPQKGLSSVWRLACEVRDKCADLARAIEAVKEQHKLFDRSYRLGALSPQRFQGVGIGYERTPTSYEEEQVELAVMNGAYRGEAELYYLKISKANDLDTDLVRIAKKLKEHLKRECLNNVPEILEEIIGCDTTKWFRKTIDKYAEKGHVKAIVTLVFPVVKTKFRAKDAESLYNRTKVTS